VSTSFRTNFIQEHQITTEQLEAGFKNLEYKEKYEELLRDDYQNKYYNMFGLYLDACEERSNWRRLYFDLLKKYNKLLEKENDNG
jgi:hypothetical protein